MYAVEVDFSLVLVVHVAGSMARRICGGLYPLSLKMVRNSTSWMREPWSQRALALRIREVRTDCLHDGDPNSGVGTDWYG